MTRSTPAGRLGTVGFAFTLLFALLLEAGGNARAGMIDPAWTTPIAPFRIASNLYYVGSRDLASYLITTPAGNILINANLRSSVPQIRQSVQQLGFRWSDTRILLNGQAHSDHIAGAAEVVRETHALNLVIEGDADVAESGGRTDFLHSAVPKFPRVHVDRVLHDGEVVSLGVPGRGGVALTAHRTAGHTRGCTTWTFDTTEPGQPNGQPEHVVIIGGMTLWGDYHLVATPGHPASYPGIAADFEHTFATLAALPCDIFLGAHGSYFGMLAKLQRMPAAGDRVWIDPAGYERAVARAHAAFEQELAKQQAHAS